MTTPQKVWERMERLDVLLNQALKEVRERSVEAAKLDSEYRRQWAEKYLCAEGTVKEREIEADRATAGLRERAKVAAALEKSATEALRTFRQQLSAMQTLAGAHREEAAFARTGPRGTAA